MIEVRFEEGNYGVRDGTELIGLYSSVYDALILASKHADSEGFTVMCNIPDDLDVPKNYYKCPECDGTMEITGVMKNEEEYGKDEYTYCPYCQLKYLTIFIPHALDQR